MRNISWTPGIINHKYDNISFTSKIAIDIGASNSRGTAKISAALENGDQVNLNKGSDTSPVKKTFLINRRGGFESEKEFTDAVASQVINTCKEINKVKKEPLTSAEIFVPGPVMFKHILLIANLRKKDGNSLNNINIKEIEKKIIEKAKQEKVDIDKKFKLKVVKDLTGTGVAIAEKLATHPKYKDKFCQGKMYAVAVMTGGGFGSVNIKSKTSSDKNLKTEVEIEASESSHDLVPDINTDNGQVTIKRLGKVGATVPCVIENFAKTLGIQDQADLKTIAGTGCAKMATEERFKLNNKIDQKAIDALVKTGLYREVEVQGNETVLEVTNSQGKFKEARKKAIDKYADTVALHAITKINEAANLIILTGPLANGINNAIVKNSSDFEANSLSKLVMKKIDKYVGDDNTCNILRKKLNFEIICDDYFKIDDNTAGAPALRHPKTTISGNDDRADWVTVPISALKK